jgi:glycosyltransferase involved in cell wall biosynthesis
MDKIKVMHVLVHFDFKGGLEQTLLYLAKNIDSKKYELSFCVFECGEGNEVVHQIRNLGHEIHNLRIKYHIYDIRTVIKLYRLFRRKKPHVVQTYWFKPNLFGRIAAKLAHVPVIIGTEVTLGDFETSSGFEPSGAKRIVNAVIDVINVQLIRISDAVVVPSEAVRRSRDRGIHSTRFRVAYPPFDYDKLAWVQRSRVRNHGLAKRHGPTIGVVARLHCEKGHRYLIDAMPQILDSFPSTKLVLVGTGPSEQELRNYVSSMKLNGSVRFTGHMDNPYEELLGMDVFVLPSYSEGLPVCILEAMAAGLPVVASRVGGIPEEVNDGQTGILIPPKDPTALAKAIVRLLSNRTLASTMGREGQKRIIARFHPHRFVQIHQTMYESLLTRKQQVKSGAACA